MREGTCWLYICFSSTYITCNVHTYQVKLVHKIGYNAHFSIKLVIRVSGPLWSVVFTRIRFSDFSGSGSGFSTRITEKCTETAPSHLRGKNLWLRNVKKHKRKQFHLETFHDRGLWIRSRKINGSGFGQYQAGSDTLLVTFFLISLHSFFFSLKKKAAERTEKQINLCRTHSLHVSAVSLSLRQHLYVAFSRSSIIMRSLCSVKKGLAGWFVGWMVVVVVESRNV